MDAQRPIPNSLDDRFWITDLGRALLRKEEATPETPEMAAMLQEVWVALVNHEDGWYLNASNLIVRIGDVLAKAGVKVLT